MSYICYATYNEDFHEFAKKIFEKLNMDVSIHVWNPLDKSKFDEEKVKVIISRGGTSIRIRKTYNIPVVEIPVPFEDIIKALIKASKMSKSIGVVGYSNLLKGLDLINPLMQVDIKQVFVLDEKEMILEIKRLKSEGVEVIVGGISQTRIAKELGMKYVRIELSEKALEYSYNEASSILDGIIRNIRKKEELNTILNHTKEGCIAIDRKGKITLINQSALGSISLLKNNLIGEKLEDVVPDLTELINVLKTGKETIQQVIYIQEKKFLCDMIPLKIDKQIVIGAIATFNDIKTITSAELRIRSENLDKGLFAHYFFKDIKGSSKQITDLINIAKKFAHTDSTVLIAGETGVGKELFAQSIHNESSRKNGPFVAVNCASIPESILESELFGYEEGAFTGARKKGKVGLFELAHKGTIFLDEISEMHINLQGRFLRVLQERQIMRLGSNQIIPIDVRIISATNRTIRELVIGNRFREDLFYRLNILSLFIPPLRQRKEDIKVLSNEFWKYHYPNNNIILTKDAIKVIMEYTWPGNIRQLKNFIEKVSVINSSPIITSETISNILINYEHDFTVNSSVNYNILKVDITKEEIIEILHHVNGHKTKAAMSLGIHRSTLWRLIKKFNIN